VELKPQKLKANAGYPIVISIPSIINFYCSRKKSSQNSLCSYRQNKSLDEKGTCWGHWQIL